ncbi:MAG: hypothetical protein F4Z02_04275 [Acidimicrobiia bacterium]|nr:hypothetical protein [Acidimicrobiia bacterium]
MADDLSTQEAREVYEAALAVESPEQLDALWEMAARFAPYTRPVGDRWGNRGLFTAAGGNFDHKLTELITNMIDSVLLRRAVEELGAGVIEPDQSAELFETPATAVGELFDPAASFSAGEQARVELRLAGPDRKRERTIIFHDLGIGMLPGDIANSLLRVGSSRKDGVLWLMGAFGRGGLTVLPNAHGWVVLTRSSLDPEAGVVLVIVRWERVGNRQTETALYQVVASWKEDGDSADPLVLPVSACPDFGSGTRLAVVGFRSEGIWASRLGDEKSLDTIVDTRLFEPPLPVYLTAPALEDRGDRVTQLRGLGRRLTANPRPDRVEGSEQLPFQYGERTFQLPVRFYLFAAGGDAGTRRRFVARNHALLLNSNGQVHAHWTPAEFRHRTDLNKLADRILVVLDTDPLPLELRTSLFTADRTDLLRNPHAVRLEEELVSFLNDWDELEEANNEMIKDSIRSSNRGRSTVQLSERIAKAAEARGWKAARIQDRKRRRRPPRPDALLDDPTELKGQDSKRLARGRTHGLSYSLNARDGFIPTRAQCRVITDHLDIDPEEDVTIGELRKGRIRVSVAVPADAELTSKSFTLRVEEWLTMQGGLHVPLEATTQIEIVDEDDGGKPQPPKPPRDRRKPAPAPIATVWMSHESEEAWEANTPGDVERVPISTFAEVGDEYKDFADAEGDGLLIKLNEEFAPLKSYVSMRAQSIGDEGVARLKDRYALGLGVYMVVADERHRRLGESGEPPDEELVGASLQAAAQGVLAMLPEFDALIAEAGLDGV